MPRAMMRETMRILLYSGKGGGDRRAAALSVRARVGLSCDMVVQHRAQAPAAAEPRLRARSDINILQRYHHSDGP